ncbi:hypothetical protein XELAEV_18021949mg [Xenopus laevis]|uniref:Uncharacterized protein n=1 Tax=Xenopus laevis TaxID=8355 RepID=A0A974HMZ9_XENLA|nr:hypothetical protein XELAEV_18021949mg [Xenopus laevis]
MNLFSASRFIIDTIGAQIRLKYSSALLKGTLPAQAHFSNRKTVFFIPCLPRAFSRLCNTLFFCFPRLLNNEMIAGNRGSSTGKF